MSNISSFQMQSIDNSMQHLHAGKLEAIGSGSNSIKNIDKINDKAKEFETVFLSQMLSHMFENVKTDGLFGGGSAEKVYRSMMVNEYGKQVSESGGFGIADEVAKFMISVQEGQQ